RQQLRERNGKKCIRRRRDALSSATAERDGAERQARAREGADGGRTGDPVDDRLEQARLTGRGQSPRQASGAGELNVGSTAPLTFTGVDRVGLGDGRRPTQRRGL